MSRALGLIIAVLAIAGLAAGLDPGTARAAEKTVRIGYQKYGTLVLLKETGKLEEKLRPLGYSVTWTEFPGGPQLLEALNVGGIDFGTTGEAPPIFAQAAGAPLLYVGNEPPAPQGEAILVAKDSPIKAVADLKGKRVALNKGSNVHYLLLEALEKAGLSYADIKPVYLAPADARAAFEQGSVEAWVIWDPYLASATATTGARTLADGTDLVSNHQFYLAERRFADADPGVVKAILAAIGDTDGWARDNLRDAAAQLGPKVGIPAPILEVALKRQGYGVSPIGDAVVAEQQRIADAFRRLSLIPRSLTIADAVWRNQ